MLGRTGLGPALRGIRQDPSRSLALAPWRGRLDGPAANRPILFRGESDDMGGHGDFELLLRSRDMNVIQAQRFEPKCVSDLGNRARTAILG